MRRFANHFYRIVNFIGARKWLQLALLLLVQGLLMLVAFNKIVTNPEAHTFIDKWDGVKNYYTYNWYVNQPDSVDYRFFNGMNYPYGDYIYYTDNTPIVAATVRWVHLNIVDLSGHFMAAYHWVVFLGIWFSTTILFFTLRKLGLPALWVFFGALFLLWLHPQILRYSHGCSNLGFSWLLLLLFYCLLHLHSYLIKSQAKAVMLWSACIVGVIVVAAFCHLYFLAMLLLWVGFFLAAHVVYGLLKRRMPWLAILSGVLIATLAIVVVFGTIKLTDGYYNDRLVSNKGYGVREWTLAFSDMFAPYHFNKLQYLFNIEYSGWLESHSYWGAGALYGFTMLLVLAVWRRYQGKQAFTLRITSTIGLFWLFMSIAAVLLMFIAMHEHISLGGKRSMFNFMSLFSYLRHVYPRITQFRSLGRFVWPLVWVVNILLLWYLASRRGKIPGFVPVIVFVFMLSDVSDMLQYYNGIYTPNPFAQQQLEQVTHRYDKVDAGRYQAILPIPYYHVGSENYDITRDPEEVQARETMQFSMAWKLPLMACQMSRTAEYQALNLTGMFQGRGTNDQMLALMDNRPVLVAVKKQLTDPCALTAAEEQLWAIDVCSLPVVQDTEAYIFYEWQPH